MEFKPEKKYIAELLSKRGRKFIIPEYQRPYKWEKSHCETLWNDIQMVQEEGEEYFLGSIIAHSKNNNEYEIIDGQQRITTFTLLFRAFYETLKEDNLGDHLKEFGECIWEYERDRGFNVEKRHLESRVIMEKESEKLNSILSETVSQSQKGKKEQSNYLKNYEYFLEQLQELKKQSATEWQKLCSFVLEEKLFVLFVVCDSQESAIKIFDTLNSRGLRLETADILKAKLYEHYKREGEEKLFIQRWKKIQNKIDERSTQQKDMNFDFFFAQYMHIIRAQKDDADTTVSGLLDFFTKKDEGKKPKYYGNAYLFDKETMPFIQELVDFWLNPEEYLNKDSSSICYLNLLNSYENNAWKSFVSCIFWKYYRESRTKLTNALEKYLPQLLKAITLYFLNNKRDFKSISYITYELNANLLQDRELLQGVQEHRFPTYEYFEEGTWSYSKKSLRYLLTLYACVYEEFETDLSNKLEIEHILPKNWQSANFNDWDEESHEEYLESIGNQMLLEKKSNIKCADNFFKEKQKYYRESKLKEAQDLGRRKKENWDQEDIDKRSEKIYQALKEFCEE